MSPQLAPRVIDLLLELENDIAGQRCGMARTRKTQPVSTGARTPTDSSSLLRPPHAAVRLLGGNLPIRVQTVKMLSFTEPFSLFAIV